MKTLPKAIVGIVAGIIFISSVSFMQAAFTLPLQNPPNGNIDAPLNLSASYQDITGGLEVDSLGVTYGINLNGVPRLVGAGWPVGTGTANCNLEVRRVDWNTGSRTFAWDDGVSSTQYPLCDDYLTAEAKAAGWGSTGLDNCLGTDGYECGSSHRPSTCLYTRLVCPSGITVSPSLISTSTYAGGSISLPINSTSTYPL